MSDLHCLIIIDLQILPYNINMNDLTANSFVFLFCLLLITDSIIFVNN